MNQYPLWRYIFLAALIVFSVLYALPNLYGDDPAIQVKPRAAVTVPTDLVTNLKSGLNKQNIPFLSIKPVDNNHAVLIRFSETETQLKAQDVVQALVGNDYVVALNLASKTPHWLRAIGAHSMKLGLDLRGGIHFLMKVDVASMIKERERNDVHLMGRQLREARIRYVGLRSGSQRITIKFRDEQTRDRAFRLLKRNFAEYEFRNTSVGGKFLLIANVTPDTIQKWQEYAVTQNMAILRERVNELGVAEPVIQQQGKDLISVDLPGIQDSARAKDLIGKVATIRLQMVDTEHDAAAAASSGVIPFGDTLYRDEDGQPLLVKNQVVLSGKSILNAQTITDQNGRPAVSIRAGGSEIPFFNKVTRENIGKPMATIYVETKNKKTIVGGKVHTTTLQVARVINVATIQQALADQFQITGLQSMAYAQDLALLLRSGAYSAGMDFVQERLVGPSLGKQNIERGIISMEVGSLLVLLFMVFYYRLFGFVVDIALLLNVVVVIAIMSLLGFTLTMPGIAGIVLTVGMAVDANVLINERIREELRNGMSPQASIHAGYERAFSTIVDANVTTLIVAIVLFALGTGPVKGFAVTLTIGLATSMLTAIVFTRAIVNLIYGRRRVDQLSIGIKV